ncbi:TnsD family Tn7-like transposition protein [Marinobacter halotolerans]|uniref:TnsD family Tn7-like transposition protein n=1 Tax=Marinobacter halotolerans TaxID=1569211 RepID=UPI0012473DAB|nr:TnsD family Tn7-like transposition protein [Marinobacter halotolerans]
MLNFPIPYDKELLYSTVARAGIRQGIISPKQLLDEIYGNRKVIATLDLPNQLEKVTRWLPPAYNVETLAYRHTLFPLYAPFIPEERRKRCLAWMAGESQGAIHLAMGVAASIVKVPSHVRYCPGCLKEQGRAVGEYFWQREWQVAGVECCERHGELLNTAIPRPLVERHRYHAASPEVCLLFPQKSVCAQSVKIQVQIRQLLQQMPAVSPSFAQWSVHYHWLAQQYGFIRGQSQIDHTAIFEAVLAKWSSKFLRRYGLGIGEPAGNLWLQAIFRKHRKSFSYLQHIIVHEALLPEFWHIGEVIDRVRDLLVQSMIAMPKRAKVEALLDLTQDQQGWMKMLEEWPPKVARAAKPALYARLYRYNRLWLKQVNSTRQRAKNVKRKPRIDWQQRDRQHLAKLREILRFLRASTSGPRQSQTFMLKQLGKSSTLEKKLHRLPRTRRLLLRYSESVAQYQVRRLRNAWKELRENFVYPPRWRLLRCAGLSEIRLTNEAWDYLNGLEDSHTAHQGNQG